MKFIRLQALMALLLASGQMCAMAAQPISGTVRKGVVSVSNKVSEGNNLMGFDLLSTLFKPGADNVIISPYSISSAMSMVTAGAQGETERQLRAALKTQSVNDIGAELSAVRKALQAQSQSAILNVANAVFVQKNYPLLPAYVKTVRTTFGGNISPVDFAQNADAQINSWVSKSTNGKIKTIVDSLPPTTRMVLANAVYFKAAWQDEFYDYMTQPDKFHVSAKSAVQVPFMNREENMLHAKNAQCEVIVLPYAHPSSCEMVVMLPSANSDLHKLVSALPKSWTQWRDSAHYEYGTLSLPKFKLTYDTSLVQSFKSLGVDDAFNPAKANFKGITSNKEGLVISDILHKTYMDVNEKGTEAAAATAIAMPGSAAPEQHKIAFEMKVDRPFLVAIADSKTKTIVFLGAVTNPSLK